MQIALQVGFKAESGEDTVTTLSVTDASRKAGVSRQTIYKQIRRGELKRTLAGIEPAELMRLYPNMANPSAVNAGASSHSAIPSDQNKLTPDSQKVTPTAQKLAANAHETSESAQEVLKEKTVQQAGTVELLVRELQWNKELLEQTKKLMERQLAEQRSLIADQARRLDEKDRFWARQVEIAQSLLPAPAPRKKFLGLF